MCDDMDRTLSAFSRLQSQLLAQPIDDRFQRFAGRPVSEETGIETVTILQPPPERGGLDAGHPQAVDEDQDGTEG
jgi:hypothetical protein